MGVYIKGMEMPTEGCKDCILVYRRWLGDICPLLKREVTGNVERGGFQTDCPLVEVKAPHGDLVDRDALIDNIKKAWDWETVNGIDTATALRQTICDVKNTPTVLEAEGKDDG